MALLRRKSVFVLDCLLLFATLLLLAPRFTGLPIHEWLGVTVILPILLHLLLSWNWISESARQMFTNADRRRRVNFVLNALLFILIVLEVISGLAVSHVALPAFGVRVINDAAWRALHNEFLGWLRLIIGLHIAMNWSWIVASARRWRTAAVTGVRGDGFLRWTGRTLAIIVLAALIGALAWWRLGPPSLMRRLPQDEIARFAWAHWLSVFQICAQAFLLTVVAYVGRRWLRVRL